MNLSALDRVGDFLRAQLLTVFVAYRNALQEVVDTTADKDGPTNAFVKRKLARFEELKDQWCTAYFRWGAGPAKSAKEQEELEDVVRQAEEQLSKECHHIFELSYYRPVWKKIPDDMEL